KVAGFTYGEELETMKNWCKEIEHRFRYETFEFDGSSIRFLGRSIPIEAVERWKKRIGTELTGEEIWCMNTTEEAMKKQPPPVPVSDDEEEQPSIYDLDESSSEIEFIEIDDDETTDKVEKEQEKEEEKEEKKMRMKNIKRRRRTSKVTSSVDEKDKSFRPRRGNRSIEQNVSEFVPRPTRSSLRLATSRSSAFSNPPFEKRSTSRSQSQESEPSPVYDAERYLRCVPNSYYEDPEVHAVLKTLIETEGRVSFYPTEPTLSEFDLRCIQMHLIEMGFTPDLIDEEDDVKRLRMNGLAYRSQENYKIISRKEDIYPLPFYDASNNPSKNFMKSLPKYEYLRVNQIDPRSENDPNRLKAKTCEYSCNCDPYVGCQQETCACMQKSSIVGKLVDENLHENTKVVECGENCACYVRKTPCPSVLKIRKIAFHVVRLDEIGFVLRAMEPIQRGEPIVEFTGVHSSYVSPEESRWAYTTAWCHEGYARYFTGISDRTACFFLSPMKKGNAGRFVCHSYFPNTGWINVYKGGTRTVEPRVVLYARDPIEAGELLYVNYGVDYGIKRQDCACTQELCHDKKTVQWLQKLSWDQGVEVLKQRELRKRARMIKMENRVWQRYAPAGSTPIINDPNETS
ncbi:hypothetical protein PFISCL1PPCAC_26651, partial [Pristionchus fissidentatus]